MGDRFYSAFVVPPGPEVSAAVAETVSVMDDEESPPPPAIRVASPALSCAPWPQSAVPGIAYERSAGPVSGIRVTAPNDQAVPYGSIPRLLLLYLCTLARDRQTTFIELDRSPEDTVRAIGLRPVFGRRSNMSRFSSQIHALAGCRFSLYNTSCQAIGWPTVAIDDVPLFEDYQFWFDAGMARRRRNRAWVRLNPVVYDLLMGDVVVVDPMAIAVLKKHVLALDLYLFAMAARAQPTDSTLVNWDSLTAYWGANYTNPYEFRRKMRGAIRAVKSAVCSSGIVSTSKGVVFPGSFVSDSTPN